MAEYYFKVASTDSGRFYGNKPTDFKVKLYRPLDLEGEWEIGLLACWIESENQLPRIQLVQLPICESLMVVGGQFRLPVLKHLMLPDGARMAWEYDPPTYIPVTQSFIESVEIHITGKDGFTPSFTEGSTLCVLHLRRREPVVK